MVFFFESSCAHVMYMGKDKFENEDLIRYGLPEDVWFHVDNLSSAHVYLRLKKGEKLKDVNPDTLVECGSLVKANSIEGCKKGHVDVVYTKWQNLKKTNGMVDGQVGFKDESRVQKIRIEKSNAIVNALNRTKEERHPDLATLQQERAIEYRKEQKELKRQADKAEKELKAQHEAAKKARSYDSLFEGDAKAPTNAEMESSADASASVAYEDDFM